MTSMPNTAVPVNMTKNQILREETLKYLATIDKNNPPKADEIEHTLIQIVADKFRIHNAPLPSKEQWQLPVKLSFSQIAEIIHHLYPIYAIPCAGADADPAYDVLGLYQSDGPYMGTYVTLEDTFRKLVRTFDYTASTRDFTEVMQVLHDMAKRKTLCTDPNLIAVNNGIFDYKKKVLMPFSPEHVFLSKARVDYHPAPVNPVLHNTDDNTDWDVESWMSELSDDPEIVNLFWEILGAIIRPNVRWNKSAWLYSEVGNNGKGTLCELMRQLCGPGTYASVAIADFAKDFRLESLVRATAIIVDENDVGSFVDKAANLKSVITNDVIQINRKYKTVISFQFRGFMVQCLNEFPRIKDKSDSFYRRQLFVPMTKCFNGIERKYIKSDYLHRTDVLEYVLHKVLHTNYYSLSEPEACKNVLAEYKEFNDPIRQFIDEMLPLCAWDLLPFAFLYDLYKVWFKKNSPSGSPQGRNTFINDLLNTLVSVPDWQSGGKSAKMRTNGRMDAPEPLILQYDLVDWKNPTYTGQNPINICKPVLAQSYRGIYRIGSAGNDDFEPPDDDDAFPSKS